MAPFSQIQGRTKKCNKWSQNGTAVSERKVYSLTLTGWGVSIGLNTRNLAAGKNWGESNIPVFSEYNNDGHTSLGQYIGQMSKEGQK